MLVVIFVKIDQKILLLKTWVYMLGAGKAERQSFPCQSRRAGVLQEKCWLQKEEKAQLLMRPELSESFCIESEFGKRLLLEVFLPKLRLLFAATSGLAAAGYCRLNFLPHAACQRCRALHLCSNASWHETSSFAKAQWPSSSCAELLFPPTKGSLLTSFLLTL